MPLISALYHIKEYIEAIYGKLTTSMQDPTFNLYRRVSHLEDLDVLGLNQAVVRNRADQEDDEHPAEAHNLETDTPPANTQTLLNSRAANSRQVQTHALSIQELVDMVLADMQTPNA